ncbi:MAG: anthranilate synthase component I [Gemmataceae bacterium]
MPHCPDFESFATLASGQTVVPVYRRLMADALTPVSAFKRIAAGAEWSFLFESVVGGERIGRYSFLGAGPFRVVEATRDRVRSWAPGQPVTETVHADPLKALEAELTAFRAPNVPGLPRFCGGAVGYAGYDTVRYLESLPNAPKDDRNIPDLSFAFYDSMVIFDHVDKTVLVVGLASVSNSTDLKKAYAAATSKVDDLVAKLQTTNDGLAITDFDPRSRNNPAKPAQSNFTKAGFEAAVNRAKEYILAGDIFQVVLSQRFQAEVKADAFDVYRSLRIVSPSPFMFFVKSPTVTLVGASPEIMCRVDNGVVTNRPLAGTRPRGRTEAEDQRLAAELLADPKERAEHIMLVDLARNDVGRVAEIGSVAISDLLTVERYSHVMHLSSSVTGKLKPGLTAFDALRAALPAGTLSGAPKVRAMEVIDELEPLRRGPYGGAVGYVDFSGNMDTCIALRTMVIHGTTAYVQAGAGIVADSVPESEYQETVNKAASLMRALTAANSACET